MIRGSWKVNVLILLILEFLINFGYLSVILTDKGCPTSSTAFLTYIPSSLDMLLVVFLKLPKNCFNSGSSLPSIPILSVWETLCPLTSFFL